MGDPVKPPFPELAMCAEDMAYNKTGSWRVMRPVIDLARCSRCARCWKFCPDAAIAIVDDAPVIDYVFCKGCGICAEECPRKCISFAQEER
jgi:2-oxoacid:acceptor oxidoreductase delta subunit (pyruvate/2-ketoisovalerate family)